ncbi:site-specific DNA-methyltransferase [Uruburuella testudinis]|uniref:Site-specific DNA-methyltransferase n=1 Tax=Uruburuella testudinis TaxID=1282863 RepID=A0ABY4DRX4_9NEIS|nr:site-specific DNA-methyltransferase [Uruburuella testudinis]UOO81782.1 site-specific DNA-methyltransferase [Uruburuella testudinis]
MHSNSYPPRDLISVVESNPYLVVDTALYPPQFQAELLSELSLNLSDGLDAATDGVLIHADNFQALNLLKTRYREQVKCIYIDPPYNTGTDNDFIYKDSYQHSSWASMMSCRFDLAKTLMNTHSGIWVSTDDGEYARLNMIMENTFGGSNFVTDVIWNSRKSVSNDALISGAINHTTFFAKDKSILETYKKTFRLPESTDGFSNPDNDPRGLWKLDPLDAPNVRANLSYGIINPQTGEIFFPPEGRCWRFEEPFVQELIKDKRILFGRTGRGKPAFKRFYEDAKEKGKTPTTLWDDVGTTTNGTKLLHTLFKDVLSKDELNKIKPKPFEFMQKIFQLYRTDKAIYLDYFAGSGTTAHAVINLNREDGGKRKYILVEQGEYFDTVLKPRVQKVVYSENWKDGKPMPSENGTEANPHNGVPQIVKVLKLESYEDTLNNLHLTDNSPRQLFEDLPEPARQAVQTDYLLHYMLEHEGRESLLNIDDFRRPFDYRLNIATSSAGAFSAQVIDLVDTFNYLIGLTVIAIDDQRYTRGFVFVEGRLPNQHEDDKTLIVWRDCEKWDYDQLPELLAKRDINPAGHEYAQVYINGDHNIATVWEEAFAGSLKLKPIEPEFLQLMFATEAV